MEVFADPKDPQGKPAIHYTTIYKVFARWADDGRCAGVCGLYGI